MLIGAPSRCASGYPPGEPPGASWRGAVQADAGGDRRRRLAAGGHHAAFVETREVDVPADLAEAGWRADARPPGPWPPAQPVEPGGDRHAFAERFAGQIVEAGEGTLALRRRQHDLVR